MDYARYVEWALPKEEGDVHVCTCSDCGALLPDDYDHRKLHDAFHDRLNKTASTATDARSRAGLFTDRIG